MKKIILISTALLLSACASNGQTTQIGMANPASVYCVQQGGQSEIKTDAQGNEYGLCHLPDGEVVEEWAYFRANQQASNDCEAESSCLLIVFYEPASREIVLEAIAQQQGEIIYDYQNFSSFAIKTPHPQQAKEELSQMKEVWQVHFDETQALPIF